MASKKEIVALIKSAFPSDFSWLVDGKRTYFDFGLCLGDKVKTNIYEFALWCRYTCKQKKYYFDLKAYKEYQKTKYDFNDIQDGKYFLFEIDGSRYGYRKILNNYFEREYNGK
jgi:hypothetical protein